MADMFLARATAYPLYVGPGISTTRVRDVHSSQNRVRNQACAIPWKPPWVVHAVYSLYGQTLHCAYAKDNVHVLCGRRTRKGVGAVRFFLFRTTCHSRALLLSPNAYKAQKGLSLLLSGCHPHPGPTIRVMQWNCAGITASKRSALHQTLLDQQIDVALLSEIKLGRKDPFKIPGYQVHAQPRTTTGGGVALLIKDDGSLVHSRKTLDTHTDPTEMVSVKLYAHLHPAPVTLTSVYLPPGNSLNTSILDQISHDDVLIAGDFNIHDPQWDTHAAPDSAGAEFAEWAARLGIAVTNDPECYTRVARHSSDAAKKSSPDITACGGNTSCDNWRLVNTVDSDHRQIFYTFTWNEDQHIPQKKKSYKATYSWHKADWDRYRMFIENRLTKRHLKKIPAKHCTTSRMYHVLVETISEAARRYCPKGHRGYLHGPLWNDRIQLADSLALELQQRLDVCTDQHHRPALFAAYITAKRQREEIIREETSRVFRKRCSELNPADGSSWRLLQSMRAPPKPSAYSILEHDGKDRRTDKAKANVFIRHFANISTKHSCAMRPGKVGIKSKDPPFTKAELKGALNMAKKGKAPGCDGIYLEQILQLGSQGKRTLLRMANHSLSTSESPDVWFLSEIRAMCKPGKDAKQLGSYRPVALTQVICKLVERMIANRLLKTVEPILDPAQSGFRPSRSTADQCAQLFDLVSTAFSTRHTESKWKNERYGRLAGVFIDFEKAFDKVDHALLLRKLEALGVSGPIRCWIRQFLVSRRARARVNNATSRCLKFSCGVPQGSILGPILFDVFINDLIVKLRESGITPGLFADDLSIYNVCDDETQCQHNLQEALNLLDQWCTENLFTVNRAKTQYMVFVKGPSKPLLTLHYRGHRIVPVDLSDKGDPPKLLGLRLGPQLNFSSHVTWLQSCLRARLSQLAAIAGTRWGPSAHDLRTFYCGHVLSVMTYLIEIWYFQLSDTSRDKLEVLHARGSRIITGLAAAVDRDSALLEANLLPIEVTAKYKSVKRAEMLKRMPNRPPDVHAAPALEVIQQVCQKYGVPLDHVREPLCHPQPLFLPWDTGPAVSIHFSCEPFFPVANHLNTEIARELKRLSNQLMLSTTPTCEYELWTDGSVVPAKGNESPAVTQSGSASVLYHGDELLCTTHSRCGPFACSYRTESVALTNGLEQCLQRNIANTTLMIATDSQSLLKALETGPITQRGYLETLIWAQLLRLATKGVDIQLIFVYGHCGTARNEHADREADAAVKDHSAPICTVWLTDFLAATLTHLKSLVAPKNSTRVSVCGTRRTKLDQTSKRPRNEQVLLAQLRTDECPLLGRLAHRLQRTRTRSCRWCTPSDHVPGEEEAVGPPKSEAVLAFEAHSLQPTKCPACDSVLSTKDNMYQHFLRAHPDKYKDEAEARLKCGRQANSRTRRTKDGSQSLHASPQDDQALDSGLQCPACGKAFKNKTWVTRHINLEAEKLSPRHLQYARVIVPKPEFSIPDGTGPCETPYHVVFECPALAHLRVKLGLEDVPPGDRGQQLFLPVVAALINDALELLRRPQRRISWSENLVSHVSDPPPQDTDYEEGITPLLRSERRLLRHLELTSRAYPYFWSVGDLHVPLPHWTTLIGNQEDTRAMRMLFRWQEADNIQEEIQSMSAEGLYDCELKDQEEDLDPSDVGDDTTDDEDDLPVFDEEYYAYLDRHEGLVDLEEDLSSAHHEQFDGD